MPITFNASSLHAGLEFHGIIENAMIHRCLDGALESAVKEISDKIWEENKERIMSSFSMEKVVADFDSKEA